MSYRADVAKHIHVQQQEADGEKELHVVLCMLNPYCLRPAGPCWFRWLLGTRGTVLARKLLIFLCESVHKCMISHKIPKKFSAERQSPLPIPHPRWGRGTPASQTLLLSAPTAPWRRTFGAAKASRPRYTSVGTGSMHRRVFGYRTLHGWNILE